MLPFRRVAGVTPFLELVNESWLIHSRRRLGRFKSTQNDVDEYDHMDGLVSSLFGAD